MEIADVENDYTTIRISKEDLKKMNVFRRKLESDNDMEMTNRNMFSLLIDIFECEMNRNEVGVKALVNKQQLNGGI